MENKKGIIIKHPTGMAHSAYDLLIHIENYEKVEEGYKFDNCRFVNHFLKTNNNYRYVTSEDNGHIPEFNWIDEYIIDLINNGWKLVEYNEDFEIISEKELK